MIRPGPPVIDKSQQPGIPGQEMPVFQRSAQIGMAGKCRRKTAERHGTKTTDDKPAVKGRRFSHIPGVKGGKKCILPYRLAAEKNRTCRRVRREASGQIQSVTESQPALKQPGPFKIRANA